MSIDLTSQIPRRFASQTVKLANGDILARFDTYNPSWCEDAAYRPLLKYLCESGANRNIFRLDSEDHVIWRVANYPTPEVEDKFIDMQPSGDSFELITFQGHIYILSVSDGTVVYVGWTRN